MDMKNGINDEIASHLKSAVETLTPNVLDQIDLSAPQLLYMEPPRHLRRTGECAARSQLPPPVCA